MSRPVEVVHAAAIVLQDAGVGSPANDARLLLAHAMGTDVTRALLSDEVSERQVAAFDQLVAGRCAGTPLQHLTGVAWFRTTSVEVGPGVFVPRPETEVMVGWVLDALRELGGGRVVELCVGSGAILKSIATELPHAELDLHGVELSEDALAYAARNLSGLGVDLRQGDLADAFIDLEGEVDLVVANPPYVPLSAWESVPAEVRDHDPALALFSGADGLDAPRAVAARAFRLLRPGGVVACEHAEVQSEQMVDLFRTAGFVDVRDNRDLTSRPRYVSARKPDVASTWQD